MGTTDHMALLADLSRQADASDGVDLARKARHVVERLSAMGAGGERLRRDLAELLAALGAPGEPGRAARSGVAALLREDPTREARQGNDMAMRSASFHAGLFVHWLRRARGETVGAAPPMLSSDDRLRLQQALDALLDRSIDDDLGLVTRTRELIGAPGVPTNAMFVRRLLANLEFLAGLLESGNLSAEDSARARAALSYVLGAPPPTHAFDLLDDAYVVDTAVSVLEPAREPWIRLLEATGRTWSVLSRTVVRDDPVPVSRSILSDAALLAEPLAVAQGALDTALFLPATGTVPVLLGLVGVFDYLFDLDAVLSETEDGTDLAVDRLGWLATHAPAGPFVMVVAPLAACKKILDQATVDGVPVSRIMAYGQISVEGGYKTWANVSGPPMLLFVDSLPEAERVLDTRPGDARIVLVDLAVTSGGEDADLPRARIRRARGPDEGRPPGSDLLETYVDEASAIDRMAVEVEAVLSQEAIAARIEILAAAVELGPTIVDALEIDPHHDVENRGRYKSLWGAADRDQEALDQTLVRLGLTDEGYKQIERAVERDVRQLRVLRMQTDPVMTAKRLMEIESRLLVPADRFLESAEVLRRAGLRIDKVVEELTSRNLRLVLWMARKYKNRLFYLDMIQEGNVGLMRAARKFDHRKGAKFGSYAGWWIRQSIEGFLSRHSRTIRIPVNTLGAVRRIGRAEAELSEKLQRQPTDAELAKATGIAEDEVARARRVAHDLEKGCVALDGPIDVETGATLNDVIPDIDAVSAPDRMDNEQMEGEARRLLETLDDVEARVLNMRFGLGDDERWTLAEVGQQIGLTKERIRQIEMKALGKLRFRAKRLGVRP